MQQPATARRPPLRWPFRANRGVGRLRLQVLAALVTVRASQDPADARPDVNHVYLGAFAFGVTLLLATLLLGGKDVHHGGGHDHDAGFSLGWAPVMSLRFWVFLFT